MAKNVIQEYSKEIIFFEPRLVNKIAKDMVEICSRVKKGDNVLIHLEPAARQLALELARLSAQKGARVYYLIQDRELNVEILKGSSRKNIARFYSFDDAKFFEADVTFIIRSPKTAFAYEKIGSWKMNEFNSAMSPALMEWRVNYSRWCLIYWPTAEEAKIEGLSYENYVKLFFQACNQPWNRIKKAQAKLADILNKANTLTLIADPNNRDPRKRTRVEMSIRGMTFLNSIIDKNYPGSEVYSSPVKESVKGQIFAAGTYSYNGKRMRDILLKIENGKIVFASAENGENNLTDILNTDEGSRYFGEVALGTNPGLTRRLFNPLLNEKVGGSFHMALGRSYQNEKQDGKTVKLFNGNVSKIHWDVTVMMRKEYGGGAVIVDGKTIQQDGKFLAKELAVLNGK